MTSLTSDTPVASLILRNAFSNTSTLFRASIFSSCSAFCACDVIIDVSLSSPSLVSRSERIFSRCRMRSSICFRSCTTWCFSRSSFSRRLRSSSYAASTRSFSPSAVSLAWLASPASSSSSS